MIEGRHSSSGVMTGRDAVAVLSLSEPLFAIGVGAVLTDGGITVADDAAAIARGTECGVVVGDPRLLTGREVDRLADEDLGVLVLAHAIDAGNVQGLVRAGARGYLRADASPTELVDGVRAVAAGHFALAPAAQDAMFRNGVDTPATPALSPREMQILSLLADGLTTPQIAARLFLGEATVKTHVQRLGLKLGERRRGRMLLRASRLGLI